MTLTLGIISDVHLGPNAFFRTHLRKMGDEASGLTAAFVEEMNDELRPDLVLNLGDVVQDVDLETDLANYAHVLDILDGLTMPIYPVVGNHDLICMEPDHILESWRRYEHLEGQPTLGEGHLYYAFHQGGWDFVVLHSRERTKNYVWMDLAQIKWLERTLEAARGPVVVVVHHPLAEQDCSGNLWFEDHPHLALVREGPHIRRLLAQSGKVKLVLNGHMHFNRVTVHQGIPYVTVQSLIENVTGGAEGKACEARSVLRLSEHGAELEVRGLDPATFSFAF